MSSVITRSAYHRALLGVGIGVRGLGVALYFAAIKRLYDLPVLMIIIGLCMALLQGYRMKNPGANTADIELNAKPSTTS